uniref:L1 transposable element RRM domain-containing protein n=1 Tax=Xiphophorus maculatus TaxID=8083 RepID=A0A3B5PXM2_XIPMA
MAEKLQKYRCGSDANATRPARTTRQRATGDADPPTTTGSDGPNMSNEEMKADILLSLRGDIAKVIRDELKGALAEDFQAIRSELQAVRSEIANNSKAIQAEMDIIKTEVRDLQGGLSTWSDQVTSLQSTVTSLQKEMSTLKDKCEDLEGSTRRSNIRIAGIEERPGSSSPQAVAKIIKEVLQMDRDIKVDRSHRTLTGRGPRDRETPRVIIAKLHHDGDAAEILRRARGRAPLFHNGHRVAFFFFPDYTASVAKARATFTEVRRALRGIKEVRYGLLYPEFLDPKTAMEYVRNNITPTESTRNAGHSCQKFALSLPVWFCGHSVHIP